jgi:triacylglycerol lipase
LVHGLLGYGQLKVCGWTIASYFSNIPEFLSASGNRVLVAQLSPTGGVAERATQLKLFLDREAPREPVHLLAHSMGGLDARYMISRLDMAARVLTLTTLGTAHRGTAFATRSLPRAWHAPGPSHPRTSGGARAFRPPRPRHTWPGQSWSGR